MTSVYSAQHLGGGAVQPTTVEDFAANVLRAADWPLSDPPRLMTGAYMPTLIEAQSQTKAAWVKFYGTEPPEGLDTQPYTQSNLQRNEVEEFIDAASLRQPQLRFVGVRSTAANIRHQTIHQALPYLDILPQLALETPLQTVPSVHQLYDKVGDFYDCAINVFAVNAHHLVQRPASDLKLSELRGLAQGTHTAHPDSTNAYSLGTLLQTLSTEAVADQTGYEVRVITTLGADFGEIERKLLRPIQQRQPAARFILNTVISSEATPHANHALTVLAADRDEITTRDPRYKGTRRYSAGNFWNRWVVTNLQSQLVIYQPRPAA